MLFVGSDSTVNSASVSPMNVIAGSDSAVNSVSVSPMNVIAGSDSTVNSASVSPMNVIAGSDSAVNSASVSPMNVIAGSDSTVNSAMTRMPGNSTETILPQRRNKHRTLPVHVYKATDEQATQDHGNQRTCENASMTNNNRNKLTKIQRQDESQTYSFPKPCTSYTTIAAPAINVGTVRGARYPLRCFFDHGRVQC